MKKLNIKIDGAEKVIQVTEEYSRGIYFVTKNTAVTNNCKTLAINLNPKNSDLELQQMVTKLGNMGVLTIGVLDKYLQYFIFKDVDKDDFRDLLADFPAESKEALQLAYAYSQL